MDSQKVVKALHDVDPRFVALCETLFGKAVDAGDVWSYLYSPVGKMGPDPSSVHVPAPIRAGRGVLVPKPVQGAVSVAKPNAAPIVPPPRKATAPAAMGVLKAVEDDVTTPVAWYGEFTKFEADKQQAFGWASVVEVNGEPVVDLQGDFITPDDIEKAAYAYVETSRVGGHQHRRSSEVYKDEPFRAGTLIESMVFTNEKIEKMGLPDDFPRGWWVGFHYDDPETWSKIRNGELTGFSIHGRGKRMPVAV